MTALPRTTAALLPLLAAPAALAHDSAASGGGVEILLLLGAVAIVAIGQKSGRPLRSSRDFGDRI